MALTLEQIRRLANGSQATNRISNPALRPSDGAAGEEAGIFETVLDYVGRPFSAIAGGITGLTSTDPSAAGQNIFDAIAGNQRFGTIDILENLGADPQSTTVQALSLISDIGVLGILDPVNYLTFGANKAGKLAKLAGNLPATRVDRARAGVSAIANFGGQRTPELFGLLKPGTFPQFSTPKFANVAFAKAQDAVFGTVSKHTPTGLKKLFESQRAIETRNPVDTRALQGFQTIETEGSKAGLKLAQAIDTATPITKKRAALFLESPEFLESGLISVPQKIAGTQIDEAIDAGLRGRKAEIEISLHRMQQGGVVFPDELRAHMAADPELARSAEYFTEQTRIGRERELLITRIDEHQEFIDRHIDDLGNFRGHADDRVDFDKAREFVNLEKTQLFEMSSRARVVDILDEPIQEYENFARLALVKEMDAITVALEGGTRKEAGDLVGRIMARTIVDKLQVGRRLVDIKSKEGQELFKALFRQADLDKLKGKGNQLDLVDLKGGDVLMDENVQAVMDIVQPMMDHAQNLMMDRVHLYDPKARAPIDNFLTHFWPGRFGSLFRKGSKQADIVNMERERIKRLVIEGGVKDLDLADEVASLLMEDINATKIGGITQNEFKGIFNQLKRRKFRFSITGINASDLGFRFENNIAKVINKQIQDANRWAFAHDAHKFMADKHGISQKAFAALDPAAKKEFVALEFHVPWLKAKDQPFAGQIYIPAEMKKLMGQFVNHSNEFTSDPGFRALLDAMHKVRKVWASWTLAPFPAFHARNLASQFMLMRQGGVDLKKAVDRELFQAATEMLGHNKLSRIASVTLSPIQSLKKGVAAQGAGALDNVIERLRLKFPDANITRESLLTLAYQDDLIRGGYVRDIGMIATADPGTLSGTGRITSFPDFWKSLFANPLDVEKAGLIRFGFNNIGAPIEDIPRFTLFLKGLENSADAGADFNRATSNGVAHSRMYAGDPSGKSLSAFENDVLKSFLPFYQWSRFNIPQQLRILGTRPDLLAPYFRAYNGTLNNFEGEFTMDDAPDWLRKNLAMPIRKVIDADGVEKFALWNPQGWIPMSEINEIADLLRGPSGSGKVIFGKLAPWFKEPLEQMLNRDAFRERELRSGQTKDMFGIVLPDWAQHMMLNIRLFSEFDRLNPFDAWTKLGQWRGSFTKDRPHRLEAEHGARWLRFFTGLSSYDINPEEELTKKMRDRHRAMEKALTGASRAVARGQISERNAFMESAQDRLDEYKLLRERLSEKREDNAQTYAARASVRNP